MVERRHGEKDYVLGVVLINLFLFFEVLKKVETFVNNSSFLIEIKVWKGRL
jgi:hypothetical protein